MENTKEPVEENYVEIHVEEVDQNDDLQMRLWYQFMRDPEDRLSIFQSPQSARTTNLSSRPSAFSAISRSPLSSRLNSVLVND